MPQPEQATVSVQFPELDEEKIPTAIYGRLSVEDGEDNESMETQIALVQDFINRMKLRKTQLSFHLKKMNGNGSQGGKNLEYRCCYIGILC